MESANQQQQSSSSSPPPLPARIGYNNSYGASGSSHAWSTRNLILNSTSLVPNLNGGTMFNPSKRNDDFAPQGDISWGSIKEELSISSADSDQSLNADLSEKLLLKTISASSFHHLNAHDQLGDHHLYSNPNFGRSGSFSHIYPSINVPNCNLTQSNSPSNFSSDMPLDLFTNARFSGDHHNLDQMIKDTFVASSRFDQMQEYRAPYCSPSRLQRSEAKRGSNSGEPSHTPKKSKLDSRPCCPPLKVRKEKLGDRIAALQQLVAPFGKTDTASVLMEAIGYIQFLQNQVKTLSVPYMKSRRAVQGGPNEEGNEETRRNLRSRGLCLVPLSCMSYVAHMDTGSCEEVWPPLPPPNYGPTLR